MKFLILILTFSISGAFANDYQSLLSEIYQIEDSLRQNARRIDRRANLASDLAVIIQNAKVQIEDRLQRRGGGGGGRVDMRLVEVALSSCSNLGTYSSRTSCYKNYLTDIRGVLGQVNRSCGSISSSTQASNCYTRALTQIKSGEISAKAVAKTACSNLGTYSSRATCYNKFLQDHPSIELNIVYGACSSISSSTQASNCYTRGLTAGTDRPEDLLLNACKNLGTYSSRVTCYKSGINTAEENGYPLMRYLRGCYSISSSTQASNCFTRSLSSL